MATLITGSGVDKVIDGSIVDADIVGVSSSKLTGALPAVDGSAVTGLTSANLTGALPAIDGASLTNMAAGGKILQAVASHDPNKSSTTSMTAVALSTTPTGITPTSTSNKVLVQISGCISNEGAGNAHFELYRIISGGATTQIDATLASLIYTHVSHRDMIGVAFLDSPNTTSSVTYAIYGKRIDGAGEPSTGGRGNDNYYKTGIRWTLSEVGN